MRARIKTDPFLIISILILLIFFFLFLNAFPFLDGNIDFVQSVNFYEKGLTGYFKLWPSVHPPLKILLTGLFYKLFGLTTVSYNLIGLIFAVVGIVSIFGLSKRLFGHKPARLSAVLLAASPLYLSNAIFGLRDYLLTSLVLAGLYFYSRSNFKLYAFLACLAVLTKETGLVFPLSVIVVEVIGLLFYKKKSSPILLAPFMIYGLWLFLLKSNGQVAWNDYNFSPYASRGAVFTIIGNLLNLRFLNEYTAQHWLHLFVLNFSWAHWLIIISLGIPLALKKGFPELTRPKDVDWELLKTKLVVLLFFFAYLLTTLTFPTYTIPRYVLPLIPITSIFLSGIVENPFFDKKLLKIAVYFILLSVGFFSLFFSVDPFSIKLWGRSEFYEEKVYDLRNSLAGNDGITYNLQYAVILRKRTEQIINVTRENIKLSYEECEKLFPDVNYQTTIEALKLDSYRLLSSCKELESIKPSPSHIL